MQTSNNAADVATRMRAKKCLCLLSVAVGIATAWFAQTFAGRQVQMDEYEEIRVLKDITYWPDIPNIEKNRTQIGTENAVIYMLCRNFELQEVLESMRHIEDRFNRRFRYPWVFLNDDNFTQEFMDLTYGLASGDAMYGYIPPEVWGVPEHIDQDRMEQCIENMTRNNVIYGSSLSYRNMCRFNSGNFFRHPLLLPFDWYWRVEPGIILFCDQEYDPFTFLRANNMVYGFVITIQEYLETIPSLWKIVTQFFDEHKEYLAPDNALNFVTSFDKLRPEDTAPESEGYNLCHFWSNFEIGSLNFFRSKEYLAYFDYLDKSGGFYYERWGDAPVHTLGLVSLANRSQIHHFADMGYYHIPFYRCPHDDYSYVSGRCVCPLNRLDSVDFQSFSCLPRWWKQVGRHFLFNFTQTPSIKTGEI